MVKTRRQSDQSRSKNHGIRERLSFEDSHSNSSSSDGDDGDDGDYSSQPNEDDDIDDVTVGTAEQDSLCNLPSTTVPSLRRSSRKRIISTSAEKRKTSSNRITTTKRHNNKIIPKKTSQRSTRRSTRTSQPKLSVETTDENVNGSKKKSSKGGKSSQTQRKKSSRYQTRQTATKPNKANSNRRDKSNIDDNSSTSISVTEEEEEEDEYILPNSASSISDATGSLFEEEEDDDNSFASVDYDVEGDSDDIVIEYDERKVGHVNDDFLNSDDTDTMDNNKDERKHQQKKFSSKLKLKAVESPTSIASVKTRALTNSSTTSNDNRRKQPPRNNQKKTTTKILDDEEQSYYSHSGDSSRSCDSSVDRNMAGANKYICFNCPSVEDEITLEPLSKTMPHVCYLAPDGKTRHCYNLQTIYKASIMKGLAQYKTTNDFGQQRLQLLQPPHFRQVMNDDTMDQIASRFGRQALNIEESFIDFKQQSQDSISFSNRMDRYMQNIIGSHDLYTCPICYTQAYHKYISSKNNRIDDDDSNDENFIYPTISSFEHDPMTILGFMDEDEYMISSHFCFRKISQIKDHLRKFHSVNPSSMAGNDLFSHFRIRAPDGLLQRYLAEKCPNEIFHANGSSMRNFWANDGNNSKYIDLMINVEERIRNLSLPDNRDDNNPFFQQFTPEKHEKIWEQVSGPFLKESKGLMDDFIANDNDEVEYLADDDDDDENKENDKDDNSDDDSIFENKTEKNDPSEVTLHPLDQMISTLRQQRRERGESSSSSDESTSKKSTNLSEKDNVFHENSNEDGDQDSVDFTFKRSPHKPRLKRRRVHESILGDTSDDDDENNNSNDDRLLTKNAVEDQNSVEIKLNKSPSKLVSTNQKRDVSKQVLGDTSDDKNDVNNNLKKEYEDEDEDSIDFKLNQSPCKTKLRVRQSNVSKMIVGDASDSDDSVNCLEITPAKLSRDNEVVDLDDSE